MKVFRKSVILLIAVTTLICAFLFNANAGMGFGGYVSYENSNVMISFDTGNMEIEIYGNGEKHISAEDLKYMHNWYNDTFGHLGYDIDEFVYLSFAEGIVSVDDISSFLPNIQTVRFPTSLKEIKAGCFKGLQNLKKIYLGENLETIGEDAFSDCPQLKTVKIPESVKYIGDGAFDKKSVSEIQGYEGSTAIKYANENSISAVILEHSKADYYGQLKQAFSYEYYTETNTLKVIGEGECQFNDAFGNGITPFFGETLGYYDENNEFVSFLHIPDLTLEFSEGITSISCVDCIFNATRIVLPNSLERIEDLAFAEMNSLKSINIPNNVEYIGDGAFQNCRL
ncbi:MAG: leucine-rich repeat domain-containing protein, partial [Acutalibacteraceae bacterium]